MNIFFTFTLFIYEKLLHLAQLKIVLQIEFPSLEKLYKKLPMMFEVPCRWFTLTQSSTVSFHFLHSKTNNPKINKHKFNQIISETEKWELWGAEPDEQLHQSANLIRVMLPQSIHMSTYIGFLHNKRSYFRKRGYAQGVHHSTLIIINFTLRAWNVISISDRSCSNSTTASSLWT